MPKREWLTIHVTCIGTDHNIAPALMDDIAAACKKYDMEAVKFGFFWGDKPNEPRQSVASTKGAK